jgi:hypothetical protein
MLPDEEHHVDAAVANGETVVRPRTAEQLYRPTDLMSLSFLTTAELQPIDGVVGQARAVEAIRFGTQVGKAGFTRLTPRCPNRRNRNLSHAVDPAPPERLFASLAGRAGNHGVRTIWTA